MSPSWVLEKTLWPLMCVRDPPAAPGACPPRMPSTRALHVCAGYGLKFDERALIFGLIGNSFAAFKGSENKKLMTKPGLKDRMGGVANQFALTEVRWLEWSPPVVPWQARPDPPRPSTRSARPSCRSPAFGR